MSAVSPAVTNAISEATTPITASFSDINAAFTLNSAYLVFFMHCGFAMVSNYLQS